MKTKKRKTHDESLSFNNEWEIEYFFIDENEKLFV